MKRYLGFLVLYVILTVIVIQTITATWSEIGTGWLHLEPITMWEGAGIGAFLVSVGFAMEAGAVVMRRIYDW